MSSCSLFLSCMGNPSGFLRQEEFTIFSSLSAISYFSSFSRKKWPYQPVHLHVQMAFSNPTVILAKPYVAFLHFYSSNTKLVLSFNTAESATYWISEKLAQLQIQPTALKDFTLPSWTGHAKGKVRPYETLITCEELGHRTGGLRGFPKGLLCISNPGHQVQVTGRLLAQSPWEHGFSVTTEEAELRASVFSSDLFLTLETTGLWPHAWHIWGCTWSAT